MAKLNELDFVVIDVETTGLYPERGDKVIEIGAVKVRKGIVCENETFQALVDPERSMSPESIAVHGIKNEELIGQPKIHEVAPLFQDFIAGCIPVAQNARFDLGFLREIAAQTQCPRIHVPYLDTMLISKNIIYHYTSGHNLDAISKRMNIQSRWERHRSLGDCYLTAYVLVAMFQQLEILGKATLKDVEGCFVEVPPLPSQTAAPAALSLF